MYKVEYVRFHRNKLELAWTVFISILLLCGMLGCCVWSCHRFIIPTNWIFQSRRELVRSIRVRTWVYNSDPVAVIVGRIRFPPLHKLSLCVLVSFLMWVVTGRPIYFYHWVGVSVMVDYVPEDIFSSVGACAPIGYLDTCQKPIVWAAVCFCTILLYCVWLSGKDVLIPSGTSQRQPFF